MHADRRPRALALTSADFGQAQTLRGLLSAVTALVPGLRARPGPERAPVAGARLTAVPEALETREEDLLAVTKLLDKPGDLQNGPRDILAPEGHVMTGDRLGQDAAYFPRGIRIRIYSPPLQAQESFSRPCAPYPQTWRSRRPGP
jgi:hypothetical protein